MAYDKNAHHAAYFDGLKELRHWFLAYGVGGPLLLISNKDIYSDIAASGEAPGIVILFAIGVAAQIAITFINKWNNWILYWYFDETKARQGAGVRFCNWLSEKFWIDVACDLVSLVMFGWATIKVLNVLLG
jgi:hypothetical protein